MNVVPYPVQPKVGLGERLQMSVRQINPCTFTCVQSASRACAGAARLDGASPARKLAPSALRVSLPIERPFGSRGTRDQLGRIPRGDRARISQDTHGASLYSLPALGAAARRSSSSRSQQIPLLVRRLTALYSALESAVLLTSLGRFGRKSLNSTLSLQGGVA
jgi:hypothetical protein